MPVQNTILDGNAAAGLLREIFAIEATTAAIICAGCGSETQIGAVRVFGGSMGAVFRCEACDTAMIRLVRTPGGYCLDMQGARRLLARHKG